jgi:hypothetical protein
MSTVTLHRPAAAPDRAPRTGVWHHVWRALEAHGRRRAAAELNRLALSQRHHDPELAQRLRELARTV